MQGLYLLECGNNYKIGLADNVQKRIKQLQTGNPIKINLICFCDFSKISGANDRFSKQVEYEFHSLFAGARVSGEWFKFTEPHLEIIKNIFKALDIGDMKYLYQLQNDAKNMVYEISTHHITE